MVLNVTAGAEPTTDSTPVLLVRGLMRQQRHWGEFKALLQDALPNPVLSIDFAGCGELYRQRSAANIAALRQSLRQQLLVMPQFNGKVHLLAISLGGMLAVDWALSYPQEVASVTLINSSARPLSPFYRRLNWRNYPAIVRCLFSGAAKREQLILALSSNNTAIHHTVLPKWLQWQQQCPVSTANALRQLYAASRFSITAKPQCPLTVISSIQDRLVSPNCSVDLASHWQARHIQHPWAGHDLALDDAPWLVQHYQQLLLNRQC